MPHTAVPTAELPTTRHLARSEMLADTLSAQCFLNALLRETTAWYWTTLPAALRLPELDSSAVAIPLDTKQGSSKEQLILPLQYRSPAGRHRFALPAFLVTERQQTAVNFEAIVQWVTQAPALLAPRPVAARQAFCKRVAQSRYNLHDTIGWHAEALPDPGLTPDFAAAEQALICGHSIHPAPRSRDPMNETDARIYAPEFGSHFALEWLALRRDALSLQSAEQFDLAENLLAFHAQERLHSEPSIGEPGTDWLPVPAHPWQLQQLYLRDDVQSLLTQGKLQPLGPGPDDWRATSSMRAVHSPRAPWMLKFSLNVRLTNSLRVLEPKEMARGLQTAEIKLMPAWAEFRRRYPAFDVLAEPAFVTLRDEQGQSISPSLVMLRENPFRNGGQDNCAVLATLTQDQLDRPCLAARLVQALVEQDGLASTRAAQDWFEAFLDCVVEPLFIAQADYGLLFGAHQQNLVIGFHDYRPARAWFRDCQGTGFSDVAHTHFGAHIPDLGERGENLLDSGMANKLFSYYLVVNSCLGLIGALGASGLTGEAPLLAALRTRLETLRRGPREDSSCLDYLLDSDSLWAKGNFICAWQGHNETTMDDPTEIYHPLNNPLREAAIRKFA